jgi:MFS family permease
MVTAAVLVGQTLGTIEARRLSASVALAGSVISAQLVGAVVALIAVRRHPAEPGRVQRLVAMGFAAVALGALVCAAAVARSSLAGLLAGSAVFGAGTAIALLLRTTAAGLFPQRRRARAVAVVAVGGIIGVVTAPFVLRLGQTASGSATPWIAIAVMAGAAALIAGSVRATAAADENPAPAIAAAGSSRAAITACVVAGVAMVSMMSIATLQLHHLGAPDDVVATVVAAHYAAMFGLAIPFGLLADRRGRRFALLAAGALLAASGVGLAADPHRYLAFAFVLALVGAGWSGAFVTGTAILADASRDAARTALVARNDLVVAVTSALAALAATILFSRGGSEAVGIAVAGLALIAILAAARIGESITPDSGGYL